MTQTANIVNTERYIQSILSVVQKHYIKGEYTEPLVTLRKEDLFVCVLEGESIYHFENGNYYLHSGDVIFLPNGCHYRREILSASYRTVLVYFYFTEITGNSPAYQVFPQILEIDLEFLKLTHKWNSGGICSQSECACLLYGIYMRLIQSETNAYLPRTKKELFEAAVQTLTEKYTEETFSVASLAVRADMSEVHFRRCFKQIYHVSPQQYLTDLRLGKAKELLRYDILPVTEIAVLSGFTDPCYFSRLFKQKTGFSPSEYRTLFGTPHPD